MRHHVFGEGEVIESEMTRRGEEEVRVRFDTAGERVLLGAVAPMDVLA